jgi:amino acid adenylation domain-containing protein
MIALSPDDLIGHIWQAARSAPAKTIVVDATREWSWHDLLWRAEGYARALRALDGRTPIVPLLCGRTGETVAAILGCLLAGRAFAPLAPDQPAERLRSCFKRLAATAFVSTLSGEAPAAADALVRVGALPAEGAALPRAPEIDPAAIVYVLFTSGSTGTPKGVMVGARNIANTIAWSEDVLPWKNDDVIGVAVNFFFDISMFDVFAALRFGVPLAILSKPSDLSHTADEIAAFGVTSIFSAPALFSHIVRTCILGDRRLRSLRRIISGGDFFQPSHILAWRAARPDVEIYNVWGPTETSIVNTMHLVSGADEIDLRSGRHAPVGRSHPRMEVAIVNEELRVLPDGERGEICMLGASVTHGYLDDPERTASAYVTIRGQRAYRTQDLGFIGADGLLRIVGRLGTMAKINGYRVDLAEVEGAASTMPAIHRAVAFVCEAEPGLQELWLAIEPRVTSEPMDIFGAKNALRRLLPVYMVPKRLVIVPDLPLTPNGKIDRLAVAVCASAVAAGGE